MKSSLMQNLNREKHHNLSLKKLKYWDQEALEKYMQSQDLKTWQ